MQTQVQLIGFDEARELFRKLPEAVSKNILRGAQRSVLKPVANDMQNLAKIRVDQKSGRYVRSIGFKALKPGTYTVASLVGYRYGVLGAPHAQLVEAGTKERRLKKPRVLTFTLASGETVTAQVTHTGIMPAFEVMKDAIAMNESEVAKNFPMEVGKSIDRVAKKYAKKYGNL